MVNHDRKDRGQAFAFGVFDQEGLPDPHQVSQQPEGHERLGRALMLEQNIEVRLTTLTAEREQHVRLAPAEPLIDEAGRLQLERAPVDATRELRRQDSSQFRSRMLGLREDILKQRVVRTRHRRSLLITFSSAQVLGSVLG